MYLDNYNYNKKSVIKIYIFKRKQVFFSYFD